MYIKFNKLQFKNILSYGNVPTEINFSTGLNLINAKNR
jgi:DNA repair exonuclease SbcCD ATPase subunit